MHIPHDFLHDLSDTILRRPVQEKPEGVEDLQTVESQASISLQVFEVLLRPQPAPSSPSRRTGNNDQEPARSGEAMLGLSDAHSLVGQPTLANQDANGSTACKRHQDTALGAIPESSCERAAPPLCLATRGPPPSRRSHCHPQRPSRLLRDDCAESKSRWTSQDVIVHLQPTTLAWEQSLLTRQLWQFLCIGANPASPTSSSKPNTALAFSQCCLRLFSHPMPQ